MATRQHRVLAVLTNPAKLEALTKTLRAAGHTVSSASTFSGARKQLSTTSPDLLISDGRLQIFNGLHLLISSKTEGVKGAMVPDAQADAMLALEATRLGATYLVKPVKASKLCRRVSNILEPAGHAKRPALAG
jgi:DNA-binding NtrC family response regulator